MASEIRVNKLNSQTGVGTITLSPTGVDISGITTVSTLKVGTGVTASEDGDIFFTGIATATTFSGSGASLTALPAAQLSGTLPAISGANLTALNGSNIASGTVADARISTLTASKLSGALPAISALNLTNVPAANVVGVHTSLNITGSTTVGGGVTISESGIEASGIGITCANINGTQIGGRRNIVINGAMNVAQRGTSSTSKGYHTIDRYYIESYGVDENPTQSQVDVSSGTTPYTNGFRKALRITNGNQTSGAGNQDLIVIFYILEAQDIANSGWNYTSPSGFITLSFWIKSSVAQNFYGRLYSYDGTPQGYAFETGSLSADTWTKVTKTIPGNSNLTIDNNNAAGLLIEISAFRGTGFTASMSLNQWGAYNANSRTPDQTSTWYTTNNATFEITGLQLEVGSVATDFEHKSFDQELQLCFRYCQVFDAVDGEYNRFAYANAASGSAYRVIFPLMREMRAKPSVAFSGAFQCPGVGSFDINNVIMESNTGSRKVACLQQGSVSTTNHNTYQFNANGDTSATVTYTAEL